MAKQRLGLNFDLKINVRIIGISIISSIIPALLVFHMASPAIIVLPIGVSLYLFIFLTLMPFLNVINVNEIKEFEHLFNNIPILEKIVCPFLKYLKILLKIMVLNRKTAKY